MKRKFPLVVCVFFAALMIMCSQAIASQMIVNPTPYEFQKNDQFDVEVWLVGLESVYDLTEYNINIGYNDPDQTLAFDGYSLTNALGPDAADLSEGNIGPGKTLLNFHQVATRTDLSSQDHNLQLFSMSFTAEEEGTSFFTFEDVFLRDQKGENSIVPSYEGYMMTDVGTADVNPIPLPGAVWLLGTSMCGIAWLRKGR